jgi:hypothetical protein
MEISIQIRNVYGNLLAYPMDTKAKAFAQIANHKTLTRNTLKQILTIGFRVNVIDQGGRVADTFTYAQAQGDNLPAVV